MKQNGDLRGKTEGFRMLKIKIFIFLRGAGSDRSENFRGV